MKNQYLFKLLITTFLSIPCFIAKAQTEVAIARNYLNQNANNEKLSTADVARMEVSSAYLSPTTGWYHIYFKQMYESIEVYNGMLSTTIKDGNVAYVASSFVPNLDNSIQQNSSITTQLSSGKTQISPVQALQIAATNVNLKTSLIADITTQKSTSLVTGLVNKATLQDKNLSNEDIQTKLYWLPYIDSTGEKPQAKVALTYNVQFLTKDGKNKWSTHVDAFSGKVLANHDEVIHCDFGKPDHDCASHTEKPFKIFPTPQTNATATVAGNTYNVFDYPLEAPTFGSRTLVSSPYNRFAPAGAGPDVTTNGWHNDGTTAYTNTRGNNVWAKDDIANDNEATIGSSPSSATLDFDFPYSQTTGSSATNLNAAITNLFYWNNILHDVLWRYGFDEPSGNFQKDNLGRGGLGNDFVYADAQNGGGTNTANFTTPGDGINGLMQMYIWSDAGSPTYTPDSDFDNAIIAHEYGHGWSSRLTGGPANSGCLQNDEQGGEGWSDYIALMTTTNWSSLTPTVASANIPRSIGTYVLGQATTGQGLRPFKYSYDKVNINNSVTYAGVGNTAVFSQPHGIGSIWATMLWDMTWEIILQDNQIVNNIYDVPATIANYRGNIAALKLVNEGLRLQPCSPSFVQARDAILQADQMLFAGRYRCAIGKAFARRGLGALASTGSSTDDRVVTEDFTPLSGPNLSSALSATACSGSPFVYTATTAASGTFTYTWARAVVSGISNAASNGTGANISETLINTTANDITVQYQITISPNACGVNLPQPQIVNVVVKKDIATLLSSPLSGTVCSGSTFNYTATTASVGTYTYAWTRAAVSGISNPAGSGSSANISETLINTTQDLIAVQYQFVVSPNACGTTPLIQPVTIVINPSTITPTVVTYSVCQNASVPSGEGLAVSSSVPPVTSFIGTIASGLTYIRGAGDNTTTYTANRAVFYKTYSFIAPSTGAVTFATTAAALSSPFPDDTYLTLYQNSFYPASPATNFLRGDDDSGPGYLSSLTQTLTAGTIYIVVVSTYETGATGTFTLQASTAGFRQTVH
jgi:Fungalysin metallopeptidase (M36)/Fungalysin/Thermolysin Propeptide Motif